MLPAVDDAIKLLVPSFNNCSFLHSSERNQGTEARSVRNNAKRSRSEDNFEKLNVSSRFEGRFCF